MKYIGTTLVCLVWLSQCDPFLDTQEDTTVFAPIAGLQHPRSLADSLVGSWQWDRTIWHVWPKDTTILTATDSVFYYSFTVDSLVLSYPQGRLTMTQSYTIQSDSSGGTRLIIDESLVFFCSIAGNTLHLDQAPFDGPNHQYLRVTP